MSRFPDKSDLPPLLVPRPEFRFPVDTLVERPWIEPFTWGVRGARVLGDPFGSPVMAQCNRVQRPPPPPHLIAQPKKSSQPQAVRTDCCLSLSVDPNVRVKQLERSLVFVSESHSQILNSLHKEVEELKNKNRELQFQLVAGASTSTESNSSTTKSSEGLEDLTQDLQKKIDKLEKEIRRLRNSLRESLQINSELTAQLEALKINQIEEHSPKKEDLPPRSHSALDLTNYVRPQTPGSESPKIDEYVDSLQQIQQAASVRTKSSRPTMEIRRSDRHYNNGGANSRNSDWGYQGERGRRYSDYQPRLPRLAVRNQQNFKQGSDTLPLLKKPLFPSLDQTERSRKPRGQRARPLGNIPQH